jgi:hypothetical protein
MKSRRSSGLAAVLVLFSAGASGVRAQGPSFVAVTAEGSLPASPLVALGRDWSLRLGGDKAMQVPGAELVELRSVARAVPAFPRAHFLQLANGDWLPLQAGRAITLTNERLHVELAASAGAKPGQALVLAQSAAMLLVLQPPADTEDPWQAWAELRRLDAASDWLVLDNGERLAGTLLGIDTVVRIRLGQRRVEVPFAKVAAVLFNSELQARPRLTRTHAQVVLATGARLTLSELSFDAAAPTMRGLMPYGAALEFAVEDLVQLELRPGRLVYLSDMAPVRFVHTPFLDLVRPLARGTTLSGKPLELGGAGYRHGLAMACRGEATYALDSKYRWFEAAVGVDPAATRGRLRFSVLLDGKPHPVGENREYAADDPPTPVRLDVRGVKRLTLVTDWGSRGNVDGYGFWANARLIK